MNEINKAIIISLHQIGGVPSATLCSVNIFEANLNHGVLHGIRIVHDRKRQPSPF